MLLSLSLQSNRPSNVIELCNNISDTVSDPSQVEILFGIDSHDHKMESTLLAQQQKHKFSIKFLKNRFEGFLKLYKYLDNMHQKLCNPNAYFVQHINDEVRFKTKNWDKILEQYKHFYTDDIFRLRCSAFKLLFYKDFKQILTKPETIPIHTKKWIDITGWCGFHSADIYQQMVATCLAHSHDNAICFSREIPIHDIIFEGLETGAKLSKKESEKRLRYAEKAWSHASKQQSKNETKLKSNLLRAEIISHSFNNTFKIIQLKNEVRLLYKNTIYKTLYSEFDVPALKNKLTFKLYIKKLLGHFLTSFIRRMYTPYTGRKYYYKDLAFCIAYYLNSTITQTEFHLDTYSDDVGFIEKKANILSYELLSIFPEEKYSRSGQNTKQKITKGQRTSEKELEKA